MSRANECAALAKEGKSIREIAEILGISNGSVIEYFYRAVGNNLISFSEIIMLWPSEIRIGIEKLISAKKNIAENELWEEIKKNPHAISREEMKAYLKMRAYYIGDLYLMIVKTEAYLHSVIKRALYEVLGKDKWWEEGIPDDIKEKCKGSCTKQCSNEDLYEYINFRQIGEIIGYNLKEIGQYFPSEINNRIDQWKRSMNKMNEIRNKVMHPRVENPIPDDESYRVVKNIYLVLFGNA